MLQNPAATNPPMHDRGARGQAGAAAMHLATEAIVPRASALVAGLPALLPEIEELYRDLHRHPELSGQEARTASAVATHLEAAGYTITRDVGGHGVVGLLRHGAGPTVALRGDMDALPLAEQTGLPYASTAMATDAAGATVPVMYACGHDLHTACLVGAARLLAGARKRWRGTLLIIGQPAEETLTGAAAMLADGLFTRLARPDVVLGQHVINARAGGLIHRAGQLFAAREATEALVNDPVAVGRVQAVHAALFGDVVWSAPAPIPFPASEDFALYGRPGPGRYAAPAVPLVYWLLGGTAPAAWERAPGSTYPEKLRALPANHHPAFAPDPGPALRRGVEALASAALTYLDAPL
jgi:metal-dependent amidase/aminoacylase/carboxypeptidase family protein